MSATPQSQAVQDANTIASLMQSAAQLADQINQVSAHYNSLNEATTLNNLATCVTIADGSLGAADGTPTEGHVIDTRVVTGLNRAVSAYNVGASLTVLQQIAALMSGSAVAQQASAPNLAAFMSGG